MYKSLRIICWILIVANTLFFIGSTSAIEQIVSGISAVIWIIIQTNFAKKTYANELWERVGVGIFSGLTVAASRDAVNHSITLTNLIFYAGATFIAIALIFMGKSGIKEESKANFPSITRS